MSESVFIMPINYHCRGCGARYAPRANRVDLCNSCADKCDRFLLKNGSDDRSENGVNRWLARRIVFETERLKRCGVAGRCEAVSKGTGGWRHNFDKQCRSYAIKFRDGRRVCGKHATATSPIFVGSVPHDPYNDLERVLTDLSRVDDRFRQCLISAIERTASRERAA